MVKLGDFFELKAAWDARSVERVVELIGDGLYVEAADKLDGVELSSEEELAHGRVFAHAYYRRALCRQRDGQRLKAIDDLEKALHFGGLSKQERLLYQGRLTAIQKSGKSAAIWRFDGAMERYFERGSANLNLRDEFLHRYGLSAPERALQIRCIDASTSIGVYRWRGDPRRNETWSRLIRKFKQGSEAERALFGRVLAEHVKASPLGLEWLAEIDFVAPVPASEVRSAERGADIVGTLAAQLGDRLSIPVRSDLLKRSSKSDHARHMGRSDLSSEYSLGARKDEVVRGRNVLLLDDIVTRGYTAGSCAKLLKDAGSGRVYLLTVAQAESSLKSERHRGESVRGDVQMLVPWLCLTETRGLGPVRLRALLDQFRGPAEVLIAEESMLQEIPAIGPKLAKAIVEQSGQLGEYPDKAARLMSEARKIDARIMTLHDRDYPVELAQSRAAPAILYALGAGMNALAESRAVAIVGTREPTEEAAKVTHELARTVAGAGWMVVSGMAEGVDSLAHAACLEAGWPTVAFVGNGVDITYPPGARSLRREILRKGVLLSEYRFGAPTNENRLRRRNTLIAGAARAVIVIQSSADGGTMNTVRAAERLKIPLFCVEPPLGQQGLFEGNAKLLGSRRARGIALGNAVDLLDSLMAEQRV